MDVGCLLENNTDVSEGLPEGFELQPSADQPIASNQSSNQLQTQDQGGMSSDLPEGFQLSEDKYGTTSEMIKTGLEGAAQGVVGPLAPLIETKVFGAKPEDILGRAEENPITHETGKVAGLVGSLATGVGEGALMAKIGTGAAEAVGLGHAIEGATLAHKVGSAVVSQAAEMAVLQSGDEVSKIILKDPPAAGESALANIGLAAALGGVAGGAITGIAHGAISPLWKATLGPKWESALAGIKARTNGETTSTLVKEAEELGLTKLTPDIEGAMSPDLAMRNNASALRQTDTSTVARGFQEREMAFKDEVADQMAATLGKQAGDVAAIDVSQASFGKDVGDELVKEYKMKIDPIIEGLESAKTKFGNAELIPDNISRVADNSNPYMATTKDIIEPGTSRTVKDKIVQMASEEGWLADRLSPEARMIRTTLKELDNKKTLAELTKLGQNIGQSTKSTLPFGMQTPLSRAGAMVRDLVRDAENDVIFAKLGKDAPELLEQYRGNLDKFKALAKLKDQLDDRLKIRGSVSGFAKGLSEMAKTDSETLLNRLSGVKDAHLLGFLTEHFPNTAQKLKQFHIDKLIEKSTKDGTLVPSKLMKNIEALSPELREFAIGGQSTERLGKLNEFLTKLQDSNHNFSNTARTVDKIMSSGGSSALGLVAALAGHTGLGIAIPLAETFGKEASSSVRLAMLKFMGSSQPIKGEAFKSMINYISDVYKGEALLNKATKNLFKAGGQVLISSQMPNERDREKLDKKVTALQQHPGKALNLAPGGDLAHYMPEQQAAMTQSTVTALNYLQSIKPQPHIIGPLDKPVPPQPVEIARYNRALDIAQQPSVVLQHIQKGTLQASDIQDIHSMYPGVYKQMASKLTNEITNQQGAEEPIPYRVRIGLSLFLGQPLDATMSPTSIQAAQPMPQEAPPTPGAKPSRAKNAPSALGKNVKSYMTPTQGAESDRAARE